jgi:hypothetical protein
LQLGLFNNCCERLQVAKPVLAVAAKLPAFLYFTVLFHLDRNKNYIPIYSFGSIDSSFVNPRQALFRSHFRPVAFKTSGTYAKTAPNTHIKHMILNGIFKRADTVGR